LIRQVHRPGESLSYLDLSAVEDDDLRSAPITTRLLVESALRARMAMHQDDPPRPEDLSAMVREIVAACAGRATTVELALMPTRLLLQDHSGLPVLADLASLRRLLDRQGIDPERACPLIAVDLVVDHSVEAFVAGTSEALGTNLAREFALNGER
jgi:aconitate hydratase